MVRSGLPAAMVALLCFYSVTASASGEELSGDILTGLLPLTSYAIAHFKDDGEGEKQFLRSTGVSQIGRAHV